MHINRYKIPCVIQRVAFASSCIARVIVVGAVVVGAAVSALKFAGSVSSFEDALSEMVVGALTDGLADVMMGCVAGIGVEMLADANANVFASLMPDLEFAVPKP